MKKKTRINVALTKMVYQPAELNIPVQTNTVGRYRTIYKWAKSSVNSSKTKHISMRIAKLINLIDSIQPNIVSLFRSIKV